MAYLATLEGDGNITLDDLFNVNDYLGVKYFGVDTWNKIKRFACAMTQNAAKNPAMFCISNINKDYSKPSQLSCELFGFNDENGVELMGDTAWNTLKCKMDDELLGWSIGGALKKVGKKVSKAVSSTRRKVSKVAAKPIKVAVKAGKTTLKLPSAAVKALTTKTPLKYTPTAKLYNVVDKKVTSKVRDKTKKVVQKTVDTASAGAASLVKKTPLKYTPQGQMILLKEETKERAGVTSAGSAGVKKSKKQKKKEEKQKAAVAKVVRTAQKAKASEQKAKKEKKATEQALEVMENRVTSKYAPIVMIGCFGLLGLAILNSKKK